MARQRGEGGLVKAGDLPVLKGITEKTKQQQIEHVFDGMVRPEDHRLDAPGFCAMLFADAPQREE
jgi:hypothetical protein